MPTWQPAGYIVVGPYRQTQLLVKAKQTVRVKKHAVLHVLLVSYTKPRLPCDLMLTLGSGNVPITFSERSQKRPQQIVISNVPRPLSETLSERSPNFVSMFCKNPPHPTRAPSGTAGT